MAGMAYLLVIGVPFGAVMLVYWASAFSGMVLWHSFEPRKE